MKTMCKVLEVSRSGYYAWAKRSTSKMFQSDARLVEDIKKVHIASRKTYGSPRIHAELIRQGIPCGQTEKNQTEEKLF